MQIGNKIKYNAGEIYYNRNNKKLFQVRKTILIDGIVICKCSGFCRYYMDCKTTISEMEMSEDYLFENCIRIIVPDKHLDIMEVDGIGWKVKGNDIF